MRPLREMMLRLKMKVASDPQYGIFEVDLQRILDEISNVVSSCVEKICKAEGLDKGKDGAAPCAESAAKLAADLVLLRHHSAGAKSATARFAGILGIEAPKLGR